MLTIHTLSGNNYDESTKSMAFPSINSKGIGEFISKNEELSSTEFMNALETWVDNLLKR